ncbi:3-dehydroquinate dehydratase [Desulfohalobiaceae bacterium Ax17]|jgi:3-dehydroquinate dehydratase-2|uniref:type II 3-dehydroquinate dehydratase n=1 Tax=Desulfovulcanus ferrireducens TaxID=2831190 RepID=UPI00207BB4BE|nr:type II 3-dehydroquinate dehydratase [Desulfovulcanus ferrireducens]MBT8762352.1 3-dehydroquinate dehydratase [Desulfovulcanus ferrireducens]
MPEFKFLIVNGPNLGYLGQRQPEIYGSQGMSSLEAMLEEKHPDFKQLVELSIFQANGEGQIIDRLEQAWKDKVDGLVVNAGAYTHTSLAIADCLAWIKIPYVEVHLSNILARESFRHQSLLAQNSLGVIAGFGLMSYVLAIEALLDHLQKK